MISEHPDDIILLDYVEGILQGRASDSVRRHIATCRACRRTLAELSDTVSELEGLPTAEIPHDVLGRARRAGMLRALARFVPVVLAATALVCAILFTRGAGGRRHAAAARATRTTPAPRLALQRRWTPERLGRRLRAAGGPDLAARVLNPPWMHGLMVVVPRTELQTARTAIAYLAGPCENPNAPGCVPVE